MVGKRGLFQHYRANHPSPLNEFLRDWTRPGWVRGKPAARFPSKPLPDHERAAYQRFFGWWFLFVGLVVIPAYVGWLIDFDTERLDSLGRWFTAIVVILFSSAGVLLLRAGKYQQFTYQQEVEERKSKTRDASAL